MDAAHLRCELFPIYGSFDYGNLRAVWHGWDRRVGGPGAGALAAGCRRLGHCGSGRTLVAAATSLPAQAADFDRTLGSGMAATVRAVRTVLDRTWADDPDGSTGCRHNRHTRTAGSDLRLLRLLAGRLCCHTGAGRVGRS